MAPKKAYTLPLMSQLYLSFLFLFRYLGLVLYIPAD